MNLILQREKIHFRGNWLIFLGTLGEAEIILGICGARQNTFREPRIFFRVMDTSMNYFKGAQIPPPWGPQRYFIEKT